ncbi:MAG: tRNA (adenosine(37)-N6)-threonylcarbamoyltransferase complex transferase subunit TsaD, partial [Gemmatimonadales bacterium]
MTGPETLLAIETSCDEASVAVLRNAELLSLTVLSQDVHEIFGGVVPELASRAHLKVIDRVVETALDGAAISIEGVDSVAVTAGPGLLGSLLVGVCYAKGIALAADLNLIGVNHLEGHLFEPKLESPELDPPFVALLVSGGHTMLLDVRAWGDYTLLGQTRDDAVGEAFDKVATLLGLGYPGGPEIERLAAEGEPRFDLPRPMLRDGFDFSFSGLKTAVLYTAKKSNDLTRDRADIAASFQAAAFDVLSHKARMALQHTGYETLVLA